MLPSGLYGSAIDSLSVVFVIFIKVVVCQLLMIFVVMFLKMMIMLMCCCNKLNECTSEFWANASYCANILTLIHCVSKNVPPLQLAIIFTYAVRLQQFLAQMLPRK